MNNKEKHNEADNFKEFAKKLVAVPKKEIDEQMNRTHDKNERRKDRKRK